VKSWKWSEEMRATWKERREGWIFRTNVKLLSTRLLKLVCKKLDCLLRCLQFCQVKHGSTAAAAAAASVLHVQFSSLKCCK